MAAPTFPKFIPTSRSFQMGDYPFKAYRAMSGVVVRRAFGNRQTGYLLTLEYKNIGDTSNEQTKANAGNANDILVHYNSAEGSMDFFALPDQVFGGMRANLKNKIQAPNNQIVWRYAEPPTVVSVKPGLSTVTVKLLGELKF